MQYDFLKNINKANILQNIVLRPKQQIFLVAKLNCIDVTMKWNMGEGFTTALAIYYIEKMLDNSKVRIRDFYFDDDIFGGILIEAPSDYSIMSVIKDMLSESNYKLIKLEANKYTIV